MHVQVLFLIVCFCSNTRNMMSILATKTKIFTRDDALEYLGRHFSLKFQGRTNKEVARHLIE